MTSFLSGIWSKVVFGAVFVGLLLLGALRLIAAGRDAERGKAATTALARTQAANAARAAASKPVTKEEEDNDPFNRDRR